MDNLNYPQKLEELEEALKFFNILERKPSKLKKVKSDLTSSDLHTSSVSANEFLIPYNMALKIGSENVRVQDKLPSGEVPDFSIVLNGRKIFFELNNLTKGKSEEKIETICQDLIEYLNNKITKENYLILIYLDTKFLLKYADSSGRIDDVLAKESFHTEIEKLKLEELVGCIGKIDFESLDWDESYQGKSLFELYQRINDYVPLRAELYNMIKEQPIVSEWSKQILAKDFIDSPLMSISYENADKNECIFIHSYEFDSDSELLRNKELLKTSKIVKEAFLLKIKKAIIEKIKKNQYEKSSPIIFAVNAFQWRLMFGTDYDQFLILKQMIQEVLKEYPQISGVIIYYSNFFNGRYIENVYADDKCAVPKQELENALIITKYDDPLLTHDKQIDFKSLDPENQK